MLAVELLGVGLGEADHLQLVYEEAGLRDGINDLANAGVGVRFDHGESAGMFRREGLLAALGFEFLASEDVGVLDDLELARPHVDSGAEVEIFELGAGLRAF